MHKAASLTRAEKLVEATRVIQSALSGVRHNDSAPPNRGDSSKPPAAGRRPLGEVLDILSRGQRSRPAPFVAPGAKTGKPPAQPDGAEFLTRSYASPAGVRPYKLYVPAHRGTGRRPLIVMLHGCTQDPDDFAAGTQMNALAEEYGFLVVYPGQTRAANQSGCWNWFDPKNQRRDKGEPSIIAGITREIVAEFEVDPKRVYVAGLSAGGAMAVVMGATYPDLYAAVGVHSGLAYESATDVAGAFMAMRGNGHGVMRNGGRASTPAQKPVRTIIFHGDADQTVHPSNAERIVAALSPGVQDGARETVSGRADGRPYSRTLIKDAAGQPLGEHWVIEGAGHAWSGGDPSGSYADAHGPDASREMVRFFLQ
jgi:poly(hydroxyalkanoate) depolymerase family esterase